MSWFVRMGRVPINYGGVRGPPDLLLWRRVLSLSVPASDRRGCFGRVPKRHSVAFSEHQKPQTGHDTFHLRRF